MALLVLASVGTAVLLIVAVSAWRDGRREARLRLEELTSSAAVLAAATAQPAYDHNQAGAFASLRAVSAMRGVKYARILDAEGRVLAETGSGARLEREAKADGGLLSVLRSTTLEARAPIVYGKRPAGKVILVGSSGNGMQRLVSSLAISGFAALAAVLVGLAIAWRMQRAISRPVLALREAMAGIQGDHDFSRPVKVEARGEIGDLVAGFNTMLAEVQTRDRAIADHLAGLEDTVRARTADLELAREAAEAANAAKSDFLATMSHEIRTPMNGIMVMAEMLSVGELPKRQRRFAEVIAKSGSSLLSIINDILDFSKIEAGKMELEKTATNVGEAAEDVCALFWERARSKGLDLAAVIDPGTPRLVAGDPVRLRQVIGNLVNNAIKFTEAGGVVVRVTPTPQGLCIAVQDSGIGIAADKLGTVFGAFSQADQSTTRKYGGTGLGLAISKRLVEAMGGEIGVASELGRGSTFYMNVPAETLEPAVPWPSLAGIGPVAVMGFGKATRAALFHYLRSSGAEAGEPDGDTPPALVLAEPSALKDFGRHVGPTICLAEYGDALPNELRRDGLADLVLVQPLRRRDLREALDQIAAGQPLTESATVETDTTAELPQFANARVLVADDSAVNREVAIEALSRLGITCEAVENGLQALERAQEGGLDLILMDGSMPEMDGYDASRAIRAWEADRGADRLAIVALTAHVVGSAAEAWREAGMDAVLHKPFTLKSLADTLGQYLKATAAAPTQRQEPEPAPAAEPTPAPAAPPGLNVDLFDQNVVGELQSMAANGKSDFVERVRKLYRDNAPGALRRVIDAATVQDPAAAALAAHALKSMSLNIGARAVADLAAQIERDGRDGHVRTGDAEALHRLLLATLDGLDGGAAPVTADSQEEIMVRELGQAIERGQFSLVYQPQVDRGGEKVVGVEVLLRWTHPTLGRVSPALFIPIAERHGLMRPITRWVVDQALADTVDIPGLTVSFNASALEFADPSFADELAVVIARRKFDPKRLEVEVTETAVLSDGEQVRETMEKLHQMGLRIALDDFGVGYSSLSHLRFFPFDKLKIDKSFVDDCCTDVQSATLIHAVVSVGRALGMKVVAEGVENDLQQKFLRAAGVHAYQGFGLSMPLSIDELKAALEPATTDVQVA